MYVELCVCVCVREREISQVFVAHFDVLMIGVGDSHLKHCGSRPVIFTVMIDDSVLSRPKLFLVLVLFKPTMENTLSASAFECHSA